MRRCPCFVVKKKVSSVNRSPFLLVSRALEVYRKVDEFFFVGFPSSRCLDRTHWTLKEGGSWLLIFRRRALSSVVLVMSLEPI